VVQRSVVRETLAYLEMEIQLGNLEVDEKTCQGVGTESLECWHWVVWEVLVVGGPVTRIGWSWGSLLVCTHTDKNHQLVEGLELDTVQEHPLVQPDLAHLAGVLNTEAQAVHTPAHLVGPAGGKVWGLLVHLDHCILSAERSNQ